jgi:hypothetical protein
VGDELVIVGHAVLRDYPLRLWHRQQEYTEGLLREFQLIAAGADTAGASTPSRLLSFAELFTTRYAPLLELVNTEREAAFAKGLIKFDSIVPLPQETPDLLRHARQVFREVNEYCRAGDLLTLMPPKDVAALRRWSNVEIERQFRGEEPIPWSGPFT